MHRKPNILLATTCRWFSAARLALSLSRVGCNVEAVCPTHHPLAVLRVVKRRYGFQACAPEASLREAIGASQPDLIIPCDDLAAIHLRRLYTVAAGTPSLASAKLAALLKRSLGEPSSYRILESRSEFLAVAREEGIPTPETTAVDTRDQVRAWCKQYGLPAVLKADGTSGGRGVKVVRTLAEALKAFDLVSAPPATLVVLKRACVDRDANLVLPWLRRHRSNVSIQRFVPGTDYNITLACWKGEVIASIGAEVLHTWETHGPASVIRVVPDGEMVNSARKLARRLQLSGLCGLDFIVDRATGLHWLIEINPRATQTGHLPLGPGHDLPAALHAALSGEREDAVSVTASETIALFPMAWQSRPTANLESAYQDVPWEEPNLVRAGEAETYLLSRPKWMQLWMRAWLRRGLESPEAPRLKAPLAEAMRSLPAWRNPGHPEVSYGAEEQSSVAREIG